MLGAILLGLLAGALARAFTPGDTPRGCLPTLAVGLLGSLVGYFVFTEGLGVGDSEALDLGGLPGAVLGSVLVLLILQAVGGRRR
jgi:uncharacterized membrane protein YeaQ/YmgE (transglycosylase-associated protein family)